MKKKTGLAEKGKAWRIATYVLLLFMIVIAVFPAIWMLSTAIKSPVELYDMPPEIIPDEPTLGNFVSVLQNSKMYQAFFNSVVITVSVVALTLFFSVLAGYGFARFKFKGSGVLKVGLLFGQMIPSVVIIIPLYFLFSKMKMLNSRVSLVIADMALTIPMGVIMLSSFFESVPRQLEEAAKIDGCTGIQALFRVVLPVAKPGMISVAIYTFINAWNSYLWPLLVTNQTSMRTVQIGVGMLYDREAASYNMIMAGITIVLIPSVLVFIIGQKQILSGTLSGAIKG